MTNIPAFIEHDPVLLATYNFANAAHTRAGQVRKYTGEPYIVHPVDVASIVHANATKNHYGDNDRVRWMIQGALLHDTVEDTDTTYNDIEAEFGLEVRNLVFWCTDVTSKEQGNRRVRKELECLRLVHAPKDAKYIKLADFISNTRSIVEHDPNFATTYLNEKQTVLEAFSAFNSMWADASHNCKADKKMLTLAWESLRKGRDQISKA